jgi:hypothetical protein
MSNRDVNGQRKSGGCGKRTILIVLGIFIFGVLAVVGGGIWYVRSLTLRYTTTTRLELPVVELEPAEQAEARATFQKLKTAFDQKSPLTVRLTPRQINGMLAVAGNGQPLRGKALVELRDGKCWVRTSVPMPADGPSWLRGRFVNGEFSLRPQVSPSGLEIHIEDAIVNGESLPPTLLEAFRKEDLMKQAIANPDAAPYARQLSRVELSDDTIAIQLNSR